MVSTRRYQYIDLGSDEVVGRRRTFKDNGISTARGQMDMVVQYQYIEQARAPMQHYKFLDVAAEELRGSFASPAESEQQLLYNARPVKLGPSGLYSARYLLPQMVVEDPQTAAQRAARVAALAEYTAETAADLPPATLSVPRETPKPEWGPRTGAAAVEVPDEEVPSEWPPAAEDATPERPPPRPVGPPRAPGQPAWGAPPGEDGIGLDDPDVEERIRAAGRVPPPTPAPSPSEPRPGNVPFPERGPAAHRLFDDGLEPEPVLERPRYRGPASVSMDLPEPFILRDDALGASGRLKRQRVSQEGDQFEGTYETYEEVAVYGDDVTPQTAAVQPPRSRVPRCTPTAFQWIDPGSDEAAVDRVRPTSESYGPSAAAAVPPRARREQAGSGFTWIDTRADEVKVDKMARHQRPTARPAARPQPPRRYIEEEEQPLERAPAPASTTAAAQLPADRTQTPVSALRPGASLAPTAGRTTVELAVEEAVATGVVEASTETSPAAAVLKEEEEVAYEEGAKKPKLPVLPLPLPGKTPLPFVPKTSQPGAADASAVASGAPKPVEKLRSSLKDVSPSPLPFVPRRRQPEGPPAQQEPDRAAVFEPPPAAPRRRRLPTLLPFIPSAPQPAPAALPPPAEASGAGAERPSARGRFARMFSRKKQPPRTQPEVNVLPTPVLVPPTSTPPATEGPPTTAAKGPPTAAAAGAPPAATTAEGPPTAAAAAGGPRAEMPRTPRPAVSPGPLLASPQRATGPVAPPPAAELATVEFEEEAVEVVVPIAEAVPAAGAPPEEFGVPEVAEELMSSEEYVFVPSTPELIPSTSAAQAATRPAAPDQASRDESAPAVQRPAAPEQAARGESAPPAAVPDQAARDESAPEAARQAAAFSQPAVYAAATPPVTVLPEIAPAQLPKTGIATGAEAKAAVGTGAKEVGAAQVEEYIAAKNGLQSEPASPTHAAPETIQQQQDITRGKPAAKPQEEQATHEATEPVSKPAAETPPTAAETKTKDVRQAPSAEGKRAVEQEEQAVEEYEVAPVREEPVTKRQKAAEEEALEQAAAGGAEETVMGRGGAVEEGGNADERLPLQEALVVSTPEGIAAGDVIPALHEAEEHLARGEPVIPYPPPHEETAASKTVLEMKEEGMSPGVPFPEVQPPAHADDKTTHKQRELSMKGTPADAHAQAPKQADVKTALEHGKERTRGQETPAEARAQAPQEGDVRVAREGEGVPTWPMFSAVPASAPELPAAADWPSIEPIELHGPERFARAERGILDSGRDFEAAQPEAAAGSAPTSEADFQHYRSPVPSFTGGAGVMESFSSDVAFYDASENIEPPPADAPGPSIPEKAPALLATKPPSYEEELSYEERGLLRSQELTEMRDRLAQQTTAEAEDGRGAQPPPQPPPQPPVQPAPAPTRPGAPVGLWPEGFTQGMADEEAGARERLAAMAARSKSQLDETQERVAALAAQGRTSIEDSRSRGLSRIAAIAQAQPKPAGTEEGNVGTAEARQRFVALDAQQRPMTTGGVPLPRDPGLGKAPTSSGGLAAPAVRGHISPARASDDKSGQTLLSTQEPGRRRSASLPELSAERAALTPTIAAMSERAEAKDKGPALQEAQFIGPSGQPSPFGATSQEAEASQQSAQTTQTIEVPPSPDMAQSGVARVLIREQKREGTEKKGSTPFKKFRRIFSGKEKEAAPEQDPQPPPTSHP